MTERNSNEELRKGEETASSISSYAGRKVLDKAKEKLLNTAVIEGAKDAIVSLVSQGLTAFASTIGASVFFVVILIMLIPAVIFSVQFIFGGASSNSLIDNNIQKAISGALHSVKTSSSTRENIVQQLNVQYGCAGNVNNLIDTGSGTYYYKTDRCEITVSYTPGIDTISKSIAAYVTAVDGTLAYYEEDATKLDKNILVDEDGNITGYDTTNLPDINNTESYITDTGEQDENGIPKFTLSDEVKDFIKESSDNPLLDGSSEAYAKEISSRAGTFFKVETNLSNWENNRIVSAKISHTEKACYLVRDLVTDEQVHEEVSMSFCNNKEDDTHYKVENKTVWLDGYRGSVVIPIYYDATDYKKDELQAITERLVSKGERCIFPATYNDNDYQGSEGCNNEEADMAVNMVLYNYYANSLNYFGLTSDEEYISSFNATAGYSGVATYSGGLDYGMFAGKRYSLNTSIAQMIWAHADRLHSQGKIGGSTTQRIGGCTYFAQMWFYDHYGVSQSKGTASGHGGQFASVVLDKHPDKFERGKSPAPGGIVSAAYGRYGHVMCVDAVDYVAGTITFSDGNYDGAGGIRIMNTMSLQQFYNLFPGTYIYANPRR